MDVVAGETPLDQAGCACACSGHAASTSTDVNQPVKRARTGPLDDLSAVRSACEHSACNPGTGSPVVAALVPAPAPAPALLAPAPASARQPWFEGLQRDVLAVAKALEAPRGSPGRRTPCCMVAPSVFVSIGEEFGLPPGAVSAGQIAQALRLLGFEHVFDLRAGADITVVEEAATLVGRLRSGGPFPMFTSCCAGWMHAAEEKFPELLGHLSSCKSPMGMASAVIKGVFARRLGVPRESLYLASLMPCPIKKWEAQRPQLARNDSPDTDVVLTTKELAQLLKARGLSWDAVPGTGEGAAFEGLLGQGTGAGAIFGVTGGVTEGVLRTAHAMLRAEEEAAGRAAPSAEVEVAAFRGLAGRREARVALPGGLELRAAVVTGVPAAAAAAEEAREGRSPYHFVEVMWCEGGCMNGPGQPKSADKEILAKRAAALYRSDERAAVRESHRSAEVRLLYETELERPLSERAREVLHTRFARAKPPADPFAPPPPPAEPAPMAVEPAEGPAELALPPSEALVVFGTETGSSEGYARELHGLLCERGLDSARCLVLDGEQCSVDQLQTSSLIVFLTSTCGDGDFPFNLQPLWQALVAAEPCPAFRRGHFAVFGLGDSTYGEKKFCCAARQLDVRLEELGLARLAAPGCGDQSAAGGAGEAWVPWRDDLLRRLKLA